MGSVSDWTLDPAVTFLNHGSFGACPTPVLAAQRAWQDRLEVEPVDFLGRELEGHVDAARSEVAAFVGADPDDLAFVPNATVGISTVLRSLRFRPGDEVLVDTHEYNAARNAVTFAAERDGARVVVAEIPFPIRDRAHVTDAILACVTPQTKLALLSHVTSPTALIFPIAELVSELGRRGIDTLVDGAHAPGMVALDVDAIGAAYYTGNCHKWLCGPKGTAFLHVRRDRQTEIRPLAISHGANSDRTDRSPFRLEFDWTGTADPSGYLALPTAIGFMGSLLPRGWPELMATNHALALAGRDLLCDAFAVDPPAPDDMIGSMATVPLPRPAPDSSQPDPWTIGEALFKTFRIEVPIIGMPARVDEAGQAGDAVPERFVRISAQYYNTLDQYGRLADALCEILGYRSSGAGPQIR
jgi:isopenicillin-N epimerase